jgi:hypothetical protein
MFFENDLKKLLKISEVIILALVAKNSVRITVAENLRFSIQHLMV